MLKDNNGKPIAPRDCQGEQPPYTYPVLRELPSDYPAANPREIAHTNGGTVPVKTTP